MTRVSTFQERRRASGARAGRAPVGLLLALAAGGLGWLVTDLHASAGEAGFTSIDPARVALDLPAGEAGLPPEWRGQVALHLARLGELSALDATLPERVRAALEELPFVREVGVAQVVWPDGLEVDVRLREPVACINIGEDFLPVASDGTVLPGYRPSPPDFGRGLLPVIGPVDRSLSHARPGDLLVEERHLDALSVAVSMREHLSLGDLEHIGPVVIDATHAPAAGVAEAGTRLHLEAGRRVLFGRPPSYVAPGELPEAEKWNHVVNAVGVLRAEGPEGQLADAQGVPFGDWDLVDVRWDVATLRPRRGYR